EGGGRDTRLPFGRIELNALEPADCRMLRVIHRLPRLHEEPKRDQSLHRLVAFEEILPAFVVLARRIRPGAKRRADVLEIMTNKRLSVVSDHRIECVASL